MSGTQFRYLSHGGRVTILLVVNSYYFYYCNYILLNYMYSFRTLVSPFSGADNSKIS